MKKLLKILLLLILLLLAMVICSPVYFLLSGSFMDSRELSHYLSAVLKDTQGFAYWSLVPDMPTVKAYSELLFYSPEFYVMFWNSVKLVFFILLGQFVIAVPAAWGFARLTFPYKNVIFNVYIVLMLMPFQVTMLSNYLTLDKLHMIDTHASIILPAVFSIFPIFIIYRFFCSVPQSVIDAAKIDGANTFHIFLKIGLPLGSSGITSAVVLGFLEYWNLVEQPLTFLRNKASWPLSLYLPNIGLELVGVALAASIITLIPSFLVFLAGQEYLEQGIVASAVKE